MFCLIKPFKWQYPYFIYSKDQNLLETPFPVIIGISKNLFCKINESDDCYYFDLENCQLYFDEKLKDDVEFFHCDYTLKKIVEFHRKYFNCKMSKFYNLNLQNGKVDFRDKNEILTDFGFNDEKISDLEENLNYYFELFGGIFQNKIFNIFENFEGYLVRKIF